MDQQENSQEIQERMTRLRSYVPPKEKKRLQIVYVLLLIFSLCGIGAFFGISAYAGNKSPEIPLPILPTNPFDSVSLESKAAIVWDIEKKQALYSRDADKTYPLASITKLMTAYTAEKHAPNILSVQINLEDLALEGDQGLMAGEIWQLQDLLDYALVTSSNDGMSAVAAAIGGSTNNTHDFNKQQFVALMNKTAEETGLASMTFNNESGLDDEIRNIAGGYGSAQDVAELLGILLFEYPELLTRTRDSQISISSLSGFHHVGPNTNLSTSRIPGLLASKTGFTDLAGGNLAIVYDAGLNRPIAIVVLSSSIEGRFRDVEKLVEKTGIYIREYEPVVKELEARQAEENIVK